MGVGESASAECNVTDFNFRDDGTITNEQRLAYLSYFNEDNYEKIKHNGSTSGGYGAIYGSASYSDFKETIGNAVSYNKVDSFSDYKHAWSQSALDENGLEAYLACLRKQGGLNFLVTSLDDEVRTLTISWSPGEHGDLKEVTIIETESKNVKNIKNLASIIKEKKWGKEERNVELPVQVANLKNPALIVIATEAGASTIYLPPKNGTTSRPGFSEKLSWNDPGTVIEQNVPPGAWGSKIAIGVEGKAFSGGDGTIWARVSIARGANMTLEQKCASGVTSQSQGMGVRIDSIDCEFFVPWDASKIIIETPNTNADARGLSARVSY